MAWPSENWPTCFHLMQKFKVTIFSLWKKKTDWSCCANMDATNEEDLF